MYKRPAALLLAIALLVFTSVPAFASQRNRDFDSGEQLSDSGEQTHEEEEDEALDSGPAPLDISRVSLPTDLSFVIDPFELSGRGAIFSEPFVLANHNEAPVLVTVLDARCVTDADGIRFLDSAFDFFSDSRDKEIQLVLRRMGEGYQEQVIPLSTTPAPPLRLVLEGGAEAAFEMTGTVNSNPEVPWRSGDVKLLVTFVLEPIELGQLPLEEAAAAPDKADPVPVDVQDEADTAQLRS